MLRLTKKQLADATATEIAVRKLREAAKPAIAGLDAATTPNLVMSDFTAALRRAWWIYHDVVLYRDRLQSAYMAMSGGRMACVNEYYDPTGAINLLSFALPVGDSMANKWKGSRPSHIHDLMDGDDFAMAQEYHHIQRLLMEVAENEEQMLRIQIHHPHLLRLAHEYDEPKGRVKKSFTLMLDNAFGISDQGLVMRRQGALIPPSQFDRAGMIHKAQTVQDKAMFLAESLVEHGCYTSDPRLNAVLCLMSEVMWIEGGVRMALLRAGRVVRKYMMRRYRGFTNMGTYGETALTAVSLDTGLIACAGGPAVYFRPADKTDMEKLRKYAATHMVSVETQQIKLILRSVYPTDRKYEGADWAASRPFLRQKFDNYVLRHNRKSRQAIAALKKRYQV